MAGGRAFARCELGEVREACGEILYTKSPVTRP